MHQFSRSSLTSSTSVRRLLELCRFQGQCVCSASRNFSTAALVPHFSVRQSGLSKNSVVYYQQLKCFSTFSSQTNGNHHQEQSTSKELGESTLLLQDGTDIQEVPVAVIRDVGENKRKGSGSAKPYILLDPTEEAAFVEGFSNFHTPQQVLAILHTIPSQEVTPVVALSILRKLFELENNFGFRNEGKSWVITTENSSMETFARMAIVNRLVDILILGDETSVLLDALDMLRYDRKSIAANVIRKSEEEEADSHSIQADILEFSKYRRKLCEQVLIRTTKGQLSLEEVCRAVCTIGQISQLFPDEIPKNFIDKMWIGISDKSHKIDESNIASLFRTIQYFQKSQRLVMTIVERKFITLWWRVNTKTVAEICDLLLMKDTIRRQHLDISGRESHHYWGIVSNRLLAAVSKSVNLNLHQVQEDELLNVTKAFYVLNFCDAAFEKTLSKYVKAKCLKISNPALIATIMDYIKKFRIRSSHILEGVGEYLLLHNSESTTNLSPPQLSSILIPFGILDYQPPNGIKFWEIAERLLMAKFVQIPPKEIIDCLLSCVYLQKYPLNFVNRIFSPYFLDRLHTSETDVNFLHEIRSRLKLLDTSLTLECGAKYNGPYLPRDFTAKSLFIDGRIIRMSHALQDPLLSIFGRKSLFKIEPSVVLPNLPLNALYIVDLLVSPKIGNEKFESAKASDGEDGSVKLSTAAVIDQVTLKNRFNLRKTDSDYYVPIKYSGGYTAILINIPEHYARDGKTLLGPQVMRIRHLKLLGFNVVNLSYDVLCGFRGTPEALRDYLKNSLKI